MKFHGKVGFMTEAQETSPGVWSDGILENLTGESISPIRPEEIMIFKIVPILRLSLTIESLLWLIHLSCRILGL